MGYREPEILGSHFSIFYPLTEALKGNPQEELNNAIARGRCEQEGTDDDLYRQKRSRHLNRPRRSEPKP